MFGFRTDGIHISAEPGGCPGEHKNGVGSVLPSCLLLGTVNDRAALCSSNVCRYVWSKDGACSNGLPVFTCRNILNHCALMCIYVTLTRIVKK